MCDEKHLQRRSNFLRITTLTLQSVLWVASMRQISCLTHYIVNISTTRVSSVWSVLVWCGVCDFKRVLRYFSFLIRSSVFWGALNGLACSSPVTIRAFSDRLFSSVFACSLSYVALLWFSSSPRCPLFLSVLFRTLFLLSSRLADTACTEGWHPSVHVHLLGLVLVI